MRESARMQLRDVRRSSRVQRNNARSLSVRAQQQRIRAMLAVMAARERLEIANSLREPPD